MILDMMPSEPLPGDDAFYFELRTRRQAPAAAYQTAVRIQIQPIHAAQHGLDSKGGKEPSGFSFDASLWTLVSPYSRWYFVDGSSCFVGPKTSDVRRTCSEY